MRMYNINSHACVCVCVWERGEREREENSESCTGWCDNTCQQLHVPHRYILWSTCLFKMFIPHQNLKYQKGFFWLEASWTSSAYVSATSTGLKCYLSWRCCSLLLYTYWMEQHQSFCSASTLLLRNSSENSVPHLPLGDASQCPSWKIKKLNLETWNSVLLIALRTSN